MKVFSLKKMIGLAAIVGIVQYARKQGGFRPMIENLMNKAKSVDLEPRDVASRTTPSSSSRNYGDEITGTSSYGGYGSGNNSRRS
jgi:hypothetical protein